MKVDFKELTFAELEKEKFDEGSLYRTTDTHDIYLDPIGGNTRQLIGGDYRAYADEKLDGYIMTMTISVLDSDGNQATGTYVNIYNTYDDGSKVSSDRIAYNGSPVTVTLPKFFRYLVEVDDILGYYTVSKSGIISQNTELTFKYTKYATYGVTWDKTATTVLARTDGAAIFEEPTPYIAGATGYGSQFDDIMPWAGMSIVENDTAGTLVAIPKFWFKWSNDDSTFSLQISNTEKEGFSVSPAHRDRGDGKGERDVVYIGRYHCSSANYKSETGVLPMVSKTRATFRSSIASLGDGIYQNDYALFWTIRMLYLVEYANWDSQAVIGYGRGNGSAVEAMGYTDTMPYHTGTTLSSRTTYGVSTQYRNIEGVWDNCLDWCDGIYFSGADVYGIINPDNFSDTTNGTLVCTRPTSGGYIKDWTISTVDGFDWMAYPSTVGGSTTTYVADYCYCDSAGVVLYVGGNYNQNLNCGMFYLNGNNSASNYNANIGSRFLLNTYDKLILRAHCFIVYYKP